MDPRTGTIVLRCLVPPWPPFTPLEDGRPMLKSGAPGLHAKVCGNVLAFDWRRAGRTPRYELLVFRGPAGVLWGAFPKAVPEASFALSPDGGLLARFVRAGSADQLEVRDLDRGAAVFTTPRGRCHPGYLAELSRMRLALFIGKMTHLIEWKDARLEVSFTRTERYEFLDRKSGGWIAGSTVASLDDLRKLTQFDEHRFLRAAVGEVIVVIDRFGHAAVLDRTGELVCVFFAFRERLAAWMPDGTRFGHRALLGGPETPGARERIGQALYRASELGGSRP